MLQTIKLFLERVFNCRIYRHSLPRGTDLFRDLSQFRSSIDGQVIFDVGANIGQTALTFAEEFPNALIHSFEPAGETFARLVSETRTVPRIVCNKLALGAQKGTVTMVINDISRINSLVPELNIRSSGTRGEELVVVDTVDGFIAANMLQNVAFLKVDTEGFDLEVLKGAEELLKSGQLKAVLVEVGFDPRNAQHVLLEAFREFLRERRFVLYGLYEQTKFWDDRLGLLYANALFVRSGPN